MFFCVLPTPTTTGLWHEGEEGAPPPRTSEQSERDRFCLLVHFNALFVRFISVTTPVRRAIYKGAACRKRDNSGKMYKRPREGCGARRRNANNVRAEKGAGAACTEQQSARAAVGGGRERQAQQFIFSCFSLIPAARHSSLFAVMSCIKVKRRANNAELTLYCTRKGFFSPKSTQHENSSLHRHTARIVRITEHHFA